MRRMYSLAQIQAIVALMASKGELDFSNVDLAVKSVDASGEITGTNIVEKMSGYSVENVNFLTNEYIGAVKTGNKLTLVVAGTLTPTTAMITAGGDTIASFVIPQEVYNKIIPIDTFGVNIARIGLAPAFSSQDVYRTGKYRCAKASNNKLDVVFLTGGSSMVADTPYAINIEITFLLSDNLAPSGE